MSAKHTQKPYSALKLAEKIISFMATRMEHESAFLSPTPDTYLPGAYDLIDLIVDELELEPKQVDAWMVKAQKDRK